jgi:hypothetical protein
MIEGLAAALKEATKEISNGIKDIAPDFAKGMETTTSSFEEADKPLTDGNKDRAKHLPQEGGNNSEVNGGWTDERGDSEWKPNPDKVPLNENPDKKTWGEILEQYDIEGIEFKEGEPDFSPIAKDTVEITDFSESRDRNFKQADIEEAKKTGSTPQEVKAWRAENNYTWHERGDCKTMDLVPSEVHNNIPHSGGISEIKKREGAV